jgi:hypothetical protein
MSDSRKRRQFISVAQAVADAQSATSEVTVSPEFSELMRIAGNTQAVAVSTEFGELAEVTGEAHTAVSSIAFANLHALADGSATVTQSTTGRYPLGERPLGNPYAETDESPRPPAKSKTRHRRQLDDPKTIAKRARIRSKWLTGKIADSGFTSYREINDNGGPTYNTIARYRSGQASTREPSVRKGLATAFRCKFSEVPE